MAEGYTYRVKTECDEMLVLVPEPKIDLARKAARENGLRGQYVEYELQPAERVCGAKDD